MPAPSPTPSDPVSSVDALPVLLHTEGFTATADLRALIERLAAKLSRRGDGLRLRLTIVREAVHVSVARFVATARLERPGQDEVAHAAAVEPDLAVQAVMAKLERIEAGRVGARKHAQHHPHGIELPAELPKL